ncbi:NUDIX hydrolase [Patulibacter americanus]|uniref:NUDIX hydrolase n=1 Tax=Patulibacter americanus TaxID=588672 RepID=UPI0003B72989|nr:NUDIX domain-containing protein [Patulibacter americanus]
MAGRQRGRRSGRPAKDPAAGAENAPSSDTSDAAGTPAGGASRSSRRRRRGRRGGRGGGATPAEKEFSSGGVVVRDGSCLVINPVRPDGRTIATLPKGHPEEGEDPPTAAIREIWEETQVTASITARLGEVVYWYQREGKRIRKTVRMYLCDHVSGEPVADGFEVTRAYWMPLEQAAKELAFPGDRKMVAEAMARRPEAR